MTWERPALERRVLSALDAEPARIPVLLGGCGSGRTSLLNRVAALFGDRRSRYIDVERVASTPERFLAAVTCAPPAGAGNARAPLPPPGRRSPRAAFDELLAFVGRKGTPPPLLLLDELLEVRTLESFPGLRGGAREFVGALANSPHRFVLASRYVNRARRLLHDFAPRMELVHLPPLTAREVDAVLREKSAARDAAARTRLGRLVHALAAGRPSYVHALSAAVSSAAAPGGDPVAVLAAQMAAGTPLSQLCRFSYELRLHRARGYGVLKAILGILAESEPLRLTEVGRQLERTPGSTKDYLSWLEDVDLVETREKRYRFSDPVLRLWVRLHGRRTAPGGQERARAVRQYAAERLGGDGVAAAAPSPAPVTSLRRPSGDLIEID
ncbi:MAG: hypothetical protein F4X11_21565 [Acidobacteria bacterium]|nr:hypothetical protein [Acidobacteriota bacterium]